MNIADKIDKTPTIESIQAENKLKGDLYNSPWSIELSHRIKYVSYWRLVASQLQTHISYSIRLDILSNELPSTYDTLYSSIQDFYKKRRCTRKELRITISQSKELRR